MLKCEKCRERAATVFIKRVLDRKSTQSSLCEECAREQALADAWLSGAIVPPGAADMPLEELLMELLGGAPDPDSFAPEEDKWSLQKLAAYDRLHSGSEFSSDEDLADATDEMDDDAETGASDEHGIELSPEELKAALEEMEPGEREAVSQMLEALDQVQEHLESIMLQHTQENDGLTPDGSLEDDTVASIQAFFASQMMLPADSELDTSELDSSDPFASDSGDYDPFEDDDEEEDDEDEADQEEGIGDAEEGEPLLPSFLLPGFLGMGGPESSLFEADGKEEDAPEFKSAPSGRCPKCRTTWDRLREDGRAGCSACYELFEEPLAETMERLQSTSQHIGKAPRAATRRKRRLDLLRARRDSRLTMLRERLKAALAADQLEEAAKLRDKIKIVESTIVEPHPES